MVMERRGKTISLGASAACLGNPTVAVLWLARTMARFGRPPKTGDVVMPGAPGPMAPVVWGDAVEARIFGLASVRAVCAKG